MTEKRRSKISKMLSIIGLISLIGIPLGLSLGIMFNSTLAYNFATASFIWLIWAMLLTYAIEHEKDKNK